MYRTRRVYTHITYTVTVDIYVLTCIRIAAVTASKTRRQKCRFDNPLTAAMSRINRTTPMSAVIVAPPHRTHNTYRVYRSRIIFDTVQTKADTWLISFRCRCDSDTPFVFAFFAFRTHFETTPWDELCVSPRHDRFYFCILLLWLLPVRLFITVYEYERVNTVLRDNL